MLKRAAVITALLTLPAHADDWVVSRAGGSVVEMPAYFDDAGALPIAEEHEDGTAFVPNETISLRQYRVLTDERPFVYLDKAVGTAEINYSVDEVGRGVVSGNIRQDVNFYASCRREPGGLVCFDVFYDADYQNEYGPMVARIARSFERRH